MTATAAVRDLMSFHSGRAVFRFDDAGDLAHVENVVTVKMNPGESIEAFIARLRREYDWRPGDELELLNNGGKLDVARITRKSR